MPMLTTPRSGPRCGPSTPRRGPVGEAHPCGRGPRGPRARRSTPSTTMTASRGARSATCSTARSSVTLIFSPAEHRVAQLLDPGAPATRGEQAHRVGGEAVLRVVEHDVAGLGDEARAAPGIVGEQVAEPPIGELGVMREQRAPFLGVHDAGHDRILRSTSFSRVPPSRRDRASPGSSSVARQPLEAIHRSSSTEGEQDRGRDEGDRAQVAAQEGQRVVDVPNASPTARNDSPIPIEYAASRRHRGMPTSPPRTRRRRRRGSARGTATTRTRMRRRGSARWPTRSGGSPWNALLRVEPRRHQQLRAREVERHQHDDRRPTRASSGRLIVERPPGRRRWPRARGS